MLADTSGCELGQLRLAGGTNNMEGRVEICIDGIWGTVSDDAWSSVDVQVVCRQLGFSAKGMCKTSKYVNEQCVITYVFNLQILLFLVTTWQHLVRVLGLYI